MIYKNEIQKCFVENDLLELNDTFIELEDYNNIDIETKKKFVSGIKPSNKQIKGCFGINNSLTLINTGLKFNNSKINENIVKGFKISNKEDNAIRYNNKCIKQFVNLYHSYFSNEISSPNNSMDLENESPKKTAQMKATSLINEYLANLANFFNLNEIYNKDNELYSIIEGENHTLSLFKLLFLNPETSKKVSSSPIFPILDTFSRNIRTTQLINWINRVNAKELEHKNFSQNLVQALKFDNLSHLLYLFLTFQENLYLNKCIYLGYEELSYVFNHQDNFLINNFIEKTLGNLTYTNFPIEIKIIYDIVFFGKFESLKMYLEKSNNSFKLNWKHILILFIKFYKPGNNDKKDISHSFEFADLFIKDQSLNKNNQFKLNIDYYLISYFCNPTSESLAKIQDIKLRSSKYFYSLLPYIIFTLFKKILPELSDINSDDQDKTEYLNKSYLTINNSRGNRKSLNSTMNPTLKFKLDNVEE